MTKRAEAQAANVGRIIGQLSNRLGEKKQDSPAEKLEDLNVRFRRLRDAIHDDKTTRANLAELNEKKIAFERAKEARARELISEADFRKAESEYEKLKALAVDTPQIEAWIEEISKLDKSVIPTSSGPAAASPVLQEMTLKALNIDLEASSLAEKLERLKAERERLEKNLVNPAFLQRVSEDHSRDSQNQVNDKQIRQDGTEAQRRDFAADSLDYVTVASAVAPLGPFKSTRSLIALAVVVAGSLLSFGAPEQAAADRELDGRSDIYSLGCILFEMLTGQVPHAGPTAQHTLARRLSTPAPDTAQRSDISPELAGIMRRALEPAPSDRYASAREFALALRNIENLSATPSTPVHTVVIDSRRSREDGAHNRRGMWLALGAVAVGLVATAVYFGMRGS